MSLKNSTEYNYLRDNYDYKYFILEEETALKENYKIFSKKDLKKELKTLKLNNSSINTVNHVAASKLNNTSINTIKYVAKQIRSRINKNLINIAVATDNNGEISKNVFGYAKKVLRSGTSSSITISSIFRRRSGHYLLYQRIEMYKSHECVYNSFLDAHIKRNEYSF